MTSLDLTWLNGEGQPQQKIVNPVGHTYRYREATISLILVSPLLPKQLGFWTSLPVCVFVTVVCFGLFVLLLRHYGIDFH